MALSLKSSLFCSLSASTTASDRPPLRAKDAAVVGGVVEHAFFERGEVDIAAVKQCLQLLKRQRAVNVLACRLAFLELHLLRGARPDENDLCARSGLLDVAADLSCRRQVVRDFINHGREVLLDVGNECRAAGACEEALFRKLCRFLIRNHICAERRFDDMIEAEALDAGDEPGRALHS